MTVTIITVCKNAENTIGQTIASVLSQDYSQIEYIIVDGSSEDRTVSVIEGAIKKNPQKNIKFISESDNGSYDAMNKGIQMASGAIIGILHSDDFYADNGVIRRIVENFIRAGVDCVFGDLLMVDNKNVNKVVRYYRSQGFTLEWFARGHMPAHPTVFLKRELYSRYGLFKMDYKIAADFELLTRFFVRGRISYCYLPEVLVYMRMAGRSTKGIESTYTLNKEILRACKENHVSTNIIKIYSKYFTKAFQLFLRRKNSLSMRGG